MKLYMIRFKYADSMSGWNWREQQGWFSGNTPEEALRKCKRFYGLGFDCEYEILEIRED